MYSAVPLPAESAALLEQASGAGLVEGLASQRDTLLEEELITAEGVSGSSLDAFLAIERPDSHVFYPDDQRAFGLTGEAAERVRISAVDILAFFLASFRASRWLRKRHIREIVHDVRRRKAAANDPTIDLDTLRRETAIFRRLRPWYPRAYLCLFDSLALVEFLARRRLYPQWVFGVQAQPFGAHCWVQVRGYLLNEGTEYAGQFTPIMAV